MTESAPPPLALSISAGTKVVIVGSSPQKTRAVAGELGVDHFTAEFARHDDVRKLAAELDAAYLRIDVLANYAGGVFGDPTRTVDGFEKTFRINHLAPFLDNLNYEGDLDPIRAAVFYPGIVRTNFGSDTTSPLMKFPSSNRWLAEGTISLWRAVCGNGRNS
ncbi:SDR family NAD(P)-dependent oxidoreductase [Streptomyces sp. NBC_01716]|uniref:SDR family NAD(P)-dependent oxidoreductase n=1 Tax=Streptomyces sp. NBC_01716 TaxID=2975917 RepID=UPI002E359B63|nr:SDR family NAD(P)-dependent oxidoreductase [Streptomyces sp. NBC_01716]